ncbi:MAG: hypothetical protein Q4F67_17390, partial [Propionibacteriaceae bacterium]|nr:hypothetical protein [Propionibacteriaceae bacterium]
MFILFMDDTDAVDSPYIQVEKSPDGTLIAAEISSNQFLSKAHQLSGDQVQYLLDQGWHPPMPDEADGNPNFNGMLDASQADDMALSLTATLRFVFGVAHPTDLLVDGHDTPDEEDGPSDSFEGEISAAWSKFAKHFESRVRALDPEERLVIPVLPERRDDAPFVRVFTTSSGQLLIAEVSGNQVLSRASRLSAAQIGDLLNLGWEPPSAPNDDLQTPNFHVLARIDDIDVVSHLVVDTFRSVFGVPHPSFLDPAPREDQLHSAVPAGDPHQDEDRLPIDQPFQASNLDELRWAVSHVIRNTYGTYVPPDRDGVFALRQGSAGLLVQVREPGAVSVTAFAVTKMRHPELATEFLSRLNEDALYVRFHVDGDSVLASCDFPAAPFIPAHLIEVMVTASKLIDEVDDEIAEITGGAVLFGGDYRDVDDAEEDGNSDDDDLPEELLALIHMDNEPGVDVDPELAARVMRRDRSLILDCIRQCEEQAIEWRTSAEQEDDDETAEVCWGEAHAWEDMASLLRRALPFTIE